MTMITAMTMTITLTMTIIMVPRIYHSSLEAELLYLEEEWESLQELLAGRNDWMLRHLGCALGALFLVWMAMNSPALGVPDRMASAMAVYASCSLLFAILESLLAQKIAGLLAAVPARVKLRDQR